jgi:hypothetical protein
MGAQGTTTVDFGAFPGASDASVAVTGQASIAASSLVEAWIYPVTTADHTADEHMVETIKAVAGNVVAGTGFTIYAFNTSTFFEPVVYANDSGSNNVTLAGALVTSQGLPRPTAGGRGTRIYGQWTVAWVWA